MATRALNQSFTNYIASSLSVLVPPDCPDGGVLRRRGLGVVFGPGSVVELGHRPPGFCCVSEVRCSVPFPSGQL